MVSRQSRLRLNVVGAPDTIRTCGLRLRRATLYPAEPRVHLLLTQCLREFLASVKRRATFSQVFEFQTSFELFFAPTGLTCAFGGQGLLERRAPPQKSGRSIGALFAG